MTSSSAFSSEQVLLGAFDDFDRAVADAVAHLLDGPVEPGDLLVKRVLDRDVQPPRADHAPRDQHAFDDRVRIVAQKPAVLERARLALGGVAHDVADVARVVLDRRPLGAGGKPRAAAAAQPGRVDLVEHRVGVEVVRLGDGVVPGVGLIRRVALVRGVGDQPVLSGVSHCRRFLSRALRPRGIRS
jgi:hypothetical protein